MRLRLVAATVLGVFATTAPALAAGVNNYNPTEGFLASGLDKGKRLVDFHVTATVPGVDVAPSLGYDVGLGGGWEFGVVSQYNFLGLGTATGSNSLDQVSGYFHGPLVRFNDNWALGVVAGANVPVHTDVPYQLAAEGILEYDLGNLAVGLNSGYLRDINGHTGNLYENLNFTYAAGAWTPYLEFAANFYQDGVTPNGYVVRGDLGYNVTDNFVADVNVGYLIPDNKWLPSAGVTVFF